MKHHNIAHRFILRTAALGSGGHPVLSIRKAVKKVEKVLTDIFRVNLGVQKDERVLVFTDTIGVDERVSAAEREKREAARKIAREAARIGQGLATTAYLEFPSVGSHGAEPPAEAWEKAFGEAVVKKFREKNIFDKLLRKKAEKIELLLAETIVRENMEDVVDCVIALSNYSTSHTRFREMLTRCAGARYASMPLFEETMITGVMTADWNAIEERTVALAQKLSDADLVRVTAPNGTSLSFSIKGRVVLADTGILTQPGAFGNLPAGEAYVAPREGTSDGVMVLEWAPTRKLTSPVTLVVKEGKVLEVSGEEEFAEELRKTFKKTPLAANIAEFGVGTNDRATKPDNILESEKILGTIHIALGDNSTFGGTVRVPFHQDFVFFNPTVEIKKGGEDATILKDGKLVP